ncbi:hypothetical protein SAMN04490220_2727 [Rhodococcus jostii]|uniref:Uncharacterized protein n=1 Tax=Rhodococcus jostii TaxID=132919 RepID=A0A1H4VTI1_RHOJO|nr:hypothetical protein SAMN04490220_2727 [Rhodococcus jostii]
MSRRHRSLLCPGEGSLSGQPRGCCSSVSDCDRDRAVVDCCVDRDLGCAASGSDEGLRHSAAARVNEDLDHCRCVAVGRESHRQSGPSPASLESTEVRSICRMHEPEIGTAPSVPRRNGVWTKRTDQPIGPSPPRLNVTVSPSEVLSRSTESSLGRAGPGICSPGCAGRQRARAATLTLFRLAASMLQSFVVSVRKGYRSPGLSSDNFVPFHQDPHPMGEAVAVNATCTGTRSAPSAQSQGSGARPASGSACGTTCPSARCRAGPSRWWFPSVRTSAWRGGEPALGVA